MKMFYKSFKELSLQKWDGMIVTGAPIELMPFEDVEYWQEIQTIFNWARTHVTSTLYICWAAQAARVRASRAAARVLRGLFFIGRLLVWGWGGCFPFVGKRG